MSADRQQACRELVERMHYYEQHPHFDGYEQTLAEYLDAMQSEPVSMQLALWRYLASKFVASEAAAKQ